MEMEALFSLPLRAYSVSSGDINVSAIYDASNNLRRLYAVPAAAWPRFSGQRRAVRRALLGAERDRISMAAWHYWAAGNVAAE